MAVHAAMMEEMDTAVGRVLDQIRAMGRSENTIVLFASDNGASPETITARGLNDPSVPIGLPGSYQAFREPWAWVSNAPLRRYKLELEEGGIRTPLLAYWPAGLKRPGRIDPTPVHLIDIVPTLLDATGLTPDVDLDGTTLLPLFEDRTLEPRTLFWEYDGQYAARSGSWKLLWPDGASAWQLYDLAADPHETRDRAADRPDIVRRLHAEWMAWADAHGVFEHPRKPRVRPTRP
jgi:arylsulfatase